jgi:S1-C subfamily serine protease
VPSRLPDPAPDGPQAALKQRVDPPVSVAPALVRQSQPRPAAYAMAPGPAQQRYLGIDEQPVVSTDGRWGMGITWVYPGSPAEDAGLRVGDVLRSANGYSTVQSGNLAWIISNTTPGDTLQLVVTRISDGRDHAITASVARGPRSKTIQSMPAPYRDNGGERQGTSRGSNPDGG